ncbi:unnamed protein product, partial [Ectocarpus sp. 13 AM-2016]
TALQGLGLQWEHRRHALTAERARAYYAGVATGEAPYLFPLGARNTHVLA